MSIIKKLSAFATGLTLLVGLVPAQVMAISQTGMVETTNISTQTGIVDFGTVRVGNTVSKTVIFVNNSTSDLQVIPAGGPNSPFSIDFGRSDVTLPSGGKAEVVFNVTPRVAEGSIESFVTFNFIKRNEFFDTQLLRLRANTLVQDNVVTGRVSQSVSVIDFGKENVNDRTGFTRAVTFTNTYNRSIGLTVVNSTGSNFDHRFVNTSSIPANGSLRIEFQFAPQSTGLKSDVFTVRTDSNDLNREYSIRLEGEGVQCFDYCTGGTDLTSDENLIRNFVVNSGSNMYFGQPASINAEFRLSRDSYVDLRVIDNRNNTVVERVFTDRYFSARSTVQNHTFVLQNPLFSGSDYRFELTADTVSYPRQNDRDTHVVNGNGTSPWPPVGRGYGCAGFVDVVAGTEFCEAVEFAVSQGIFTGDTGGLNNTLRPNDPVVRAEAVAIMLRAVDAPTNSDYPLPFYDVNNYAWYAPVLRKAVQIGAIQGFPDGTFRPTNVMTRAEFYKAFVRTVKQQGRGNFFLNSDVRYRPFADVTKQAVNNWYLPYADWARRYFDNTDFAQRQYGTRQLGVTEPTGLFRPDEAMTRGHIIELIHEMNKKNVADF